MEIESFFDNSTMSVHLRENNFPFAKKGIPGQMVYEKIKNKILSQEDIKLLAKDIMESETSSIEIDRQGSTIIQKGKIRIVITRPPFSDGWEITAVRPVKLLDLKEYNLSSKLMDRIKEHAEGILIAGSPGHGKTTFARALALFYAQNNKIVKTVESPRDLILPDNITQFSISHGSSEEIRDILLLSRPDYTIFDEMRNLEDFKLFSDLRLSGVGMIGILHASNAVDAIQRFIGKIELGMIPQIIDTVIFIQNGKVSKVYELKMTVKVPSGMMAADLARPVVNINDFETGKLEYEIYAYGEEAVVIPVLEIVKSEHNILQLIEKRLSKISKKIKVESENEKSFNIFVPKKTAHEFEAEFDKEIKSIEKDYEITIQIEKTLPQGEKIIFELKAENRHITISPQKDSIGKEADIYSDGDFVLRAKVGKKNQIRIDAESEQGKQILTAIKLGKEIEIRV